MHAAGNRRIPEIVRRVGLTGGIACGKSTVCGFFASLGAGIISADEVAHEIVRPGEEAYGLIVECFGTAILNEDATINRAALGLMVFNSDDLRRRLNDITHPIIIRRTSEMMKALEAGNRHPVAIVDAALMVESGSYRRFEKLIVVWCAETQQVRRLCVRSHLTEAEARQRILAQMPLAEKRKYGDYEIDTSGSREHTRGQVERIYHALLKS